MAKKNETGTTDAAAIPVTTESLLDESNPAAELQRFQQGLDFIKEVRADILHANQQPTKIDGGDKTVDPQTTPPGGTPYQASPSRIGRFDIGQKLGEGGFAVVYLAFDPVLNREVAVKILKTAPRIHSEAYARFQREARATATLSHPGIVPVFDAGFAEQQPYIVSAFCNGPSLAEWIDERTHIDLVSSAKIVSTIASAVHYAHQRGIIHRDLKPANILLELSDETLANKPVHERIRITDFGLAKTNDDVDQLKTVEGAIVGTPAFMSPEQAEGLQITPASDIYSVGVILYQLLTGKLPLVAETHLKTIYAIAHQEVPAPARLNKEIPRDLEAICLKCLQKSPVLRYASAYELVEDLNRWLNGETVNARLATVPEKMIKWCRNNPIVSLAIVMTTAALIFALFQLDRATRNFQRAQSESQKANRNVEFAQSTVKELVSKIAQSTNMPVELRRDLVSRAVELQDKLLADNPDDKDIIFETAESYVALSDVQASLRNFESALNSIDNAMMLIEKIGSDSWTPRHRNAFDRAKIKKSEILLVQLRNDEALELLQVTDSADPHQQAMKISMQARSLRNQRKYDEARLQLQKAVAIAHAMNDSPSKSGILARLYNDAGNIEFQSGNLEESESNYLKGIDLQTTVIDQVPFSESTDELLGVLYMRASTVQHELQKHIEAEKSIRRSIEIYDKLVEFDPEAPRFTVAAVDNRLILLKSLLLAENFEQIQQVLDEAQKLFIGLPLPVAPDEMSSRKSVFDNLQKRSLAFRMVDYRMRIVETGADRVGAATQLAATQTLMDYLSTHFDANEKFEQLKARFELLQN